VGDTGYACKALIGRTEVNLSAHRWEVNVKPDINELWWQGVDWIQLPLHEVQWWDVVRLVMNSVSRGVFIALWLINPFFWGVTPCH
jgi:hypothetical protein